MSARKGTPKATPKKRARIKRIAAKVAAGKRVTEIAADEGISRTTASAYVNSPPVQQMVARILDGRAAQAEQYVDLALQAIADAFSAELLAIEKLKRADGQLVQKVTVLGPDHYARLTAARRLLDYLVAGRPTPKPIDVEPQRGATADEIRAMLREEEEARKAAWPKPN